MNVLIHHLTVLGGGRLVCLGVFGIAVGAMAGSVQAQVVTFDTSANTTAQSIAASQNASQEASGVSGTPALTRTTLTASGGAAGSFFSNGGGNNTNTLDLTKDYVGFTIAPSTGNVLFATNINFTSQGSSTAPNSYAIAYSTDGFTTSSQQTFTGTTATTVQSRAYDVTDLVTNDTLGVRLYNYGATSIGNGTASASGSYRVITPTVLGSTVATSAGAIALAAATEVRDAGALSLGGVISGNFAVTKTGAGTLTLSGNNSYTGATTISAGTLSAVGTGSNQALGGTTSVAINNGGTLSLAADNQINSAAAVMLGSSTGTGTANFSTGSHVQTVGALTLTASASITLGGGASSLTFGSVSSFATGATLSILNYSGLVYQADGVTTSGTAGDTLFISGLNTTQLAQVQFVNPAGYTGTFGAFMNGSGEVFAQVPEPTTVMGGLLLIGAASWSQRRRMHAVCAA